MRLSLSFGRLSIFPSNIAQCRRFESTQIATDSDAYQYLHKSPIPTYHFQKSLRRLPIPKLEDSCGRYLNAVQAVVGETTEFREAEQNVKAFLDGEGPDLQQALLDYDRKHKSSSYISEPWFDIYLRSRLPCPVNFNPFMMYAPDPDPAYNNQLLRATNFVIAYGRFKKALDEEVLAPEVFHLNPKKSDSNFFRLVCKTLPSNLSWFGAVAFKAFPLDMSQYTSLFGGCRIPQKGKDRLHLNRQSRHFLVMRNGKFYSVDLFDSNGNLLPAHIVQACLAKILAENRGDAPKPNECVGSLTTLERDKWAEVRQELLLAGEKNSLALKQIDDSLFLLCLDDLKSVDHGRLVASLLCGDNGSNRWFDKCFQLIVDGNGQATINFEHSWGDGVAILRLMEESFKDTIKNRFVRFEDSVVDSTIMVSDYSKNINFELNDSLRQQISMAQNEHMESCSDLQFGTMEYKEMSRDTIKNFKLSPDSIMQLGIQLAFYRQYKDFVPTYESCSTAAFLKGRTECIRSATLATRETVLAIQKWEDSNERGGDESKLLSLFRKCSDVHTQLVKEAAMGNGFDRHLLGLKITAERLGQPQPALFTDPVYKKMGHFVLSTSTLSTDTIVFGGFGPVVEDGFGIGYNVVGSKLGAVVASNKSKRDALKFCDSLKSSLDIIHRVLKKTG